MSCLSAADIPNHKNTWDTFIIKLILLFPITTLLQSLSIFAVINKTMVFLLIITILLNPTKYTLSEIFIFLILFFSFIMELIYTNYNALYLNEYFYLPLWILYLIYYTQNNDTVATILKNNIKYIRFIIWIWIIIAICYQLFQHVSIHTVSIDHRASSTCLFVLMLIWVYIAVTGKKRMILLCAIPIFLTLMESARIYLAVNVLVLICIYYACCNRRSNFYLTIVPLFICFLYILTFTPMMNKINGSLQSNSVYDSLGMLTSGRSVFFKIDWDAFLRLPVWNQIVGNGISYVHEVNAQYYNTAIWAHNDYLNILLGNGYLGLILYFSVFVNFCRKCFAPVVEHRKFYIIAFLLSCFLNAMLNGLYLYIATMLAMPFMMTAVTLSPKTMPVLNRADSGKYFKFRKGEPERIYPQGDPYENINY